MSRKLVHNKTKEIVEDRRDKRTTEKQNTGN